MEVIIVVECLKQTVVIGVIENLALNLKYGNFLCCCKKSSCVGLKINQLVSEYVLFTNLPISSKPL